MSLRKSIRQRKLNLKSKIVVLSGAGISAESGIKTFRDVDGLWENHRIEDVATPEAWHKNPALVLEFYNQRRKQLLSVQPNQAHFGLKELERDFDVHIITQNVDDLHERAGSSKVLHLHGSLLSKCSSLDKSYATPVSEDMSLDEKAPDGSVFRPDIVWFGEDVPLFETAIDIAESADIFLIVGTSMQVYPAANLISYIKENTPVYVIDKNIPKLYNRNLTAIEATASQGVKEFTEMIRKN